MSRPPLPLGTWGNISRTEMEKGRWVARCRFRDFDGRTRKVEAWGKSGAAAERALVLALADRAAPSIDNLTPETRISALAEQWLRSVQESALAAGTQQKYTETVARYVTPGFGGVRIREVTVGRLEALLRTIHDKHGPASARQTRTVLSGMFALAARHDAAPRNIVKDSQAVRSTAKEVRALTAVEVRALRAKLRADKVAVRSDVPDVIDALLATGARIGEVLALRWDDVDLGAEIPTITVSGTVIRIAGHGLTIQDHPKSASSRRRLRIPPFLVEVLLRRQVAQVEATAFNVVFPSSVGTVRDPYRFRDQWRAARDRSGFTWVVPHTFRKSVATVLAAAEGSKTAAGQLGHAGTAVTERHYIAKTHEGPDARSLLEPFGGPDDHLKSESAG